MAKISIDQRGKSVSSARMPARTFSYCLAASSIAIAAVPSHAQSVPNAGSLQRELRQGLPGSVSQPTQAPSVSQSSETAIGGETVRVNRFQVNGSNLLTDAEIAQATKPFVGRELSLHDLQAATQAVANAYRRHGYFARAILPPQDVTSGTVIIQIIEGRFGKIVTDDKASRADAGYVARVVGGRLTPGAPYSDKDLERGLLIANDMPGIRADGILKAGTEPGTSDLALTITDAPLVSGSVTADNGGVDSTGIYRGIASLAFNNVTGKGDQITLLGLGSRHLGYGQIGWNVPLGSGGWRAGVYASYMRYTLGGDFSDLDGRGNADTQGLEITYPVIRSETHTLQFRTAYEHGHYHDDLLSQPAHRKQVNRVALSLNGDAVDGIWGGGRTRYALTVTLGSLDLTDLASDRALDRPAADTNGAYGKLEAELTRDQHLAGPFFLRLRARGQWAMNNLDSSEQFSLGGPYGVRAFPVNEAMGDRGAVGSAELHIPFSNGSALKGLDLYGFVDGGTIKLHTQTWAGWNEPGADNVYNLAGAGAGIIYALPYGFSVAAIVAAPITNNPGGPDKQHNQDGSKRNARGWFTVSKNF